MSNSTSRKVIPDLNHQHDCFSEILDLWFPDPLFPELSSTMFVGTNHGHDSVIKAIKGFASFIANTHVDWGAPSQASVQTATCGTELNALKLAVERAVMMRCHLRSMGVLVSKPTTT